MDQPEVQLPESHQEIRENISLTLQAVAGWIRKYKWALLGALGVVVLGYVILFSSPLSFASGAVVKVPKGATVREVASLLKEKHLIRSSLVFEALARTSDAQVVAGEYAFPSRENVFTIARRVALGDYKIASVKVTVIEGMTARNIASLLDKSLQDFDSSEFLSLALPKEGYLFPDTYNFLPGEDPQTVLTAMLNNFSVQTGKIATTTLLAGRSFNDLVVMASLLEREAPDTESRRIIAGILWKRIDLGIALQVDAAFTYILDKNGLQLTKSDLKVDSPYNTYTHKGLPPGPIANPGIDSILAAIMPIKTNYLFYLSDLHGNLHYCSTYACQQQNQDKYLR